jgi:hypothetical protein
MSFIYTLFNKGKTRALIKLSIGSCNIYKLDIGGTSPWPYALKTQTTPHQLGTRDIIESPYGDP